MIGGVYRVLCMRFYYGQVQEQPEILFPSGQMKRCLEWYIWNWKPGTEKITRHSHLKGRRFICCQSVRIITSILSFPSVLYVLSLDSRIQKGIPIQGIIRTPSNLCLSSYGIYMKLWITRRRSSTVGKRTLPSASHSLPLIGSASGLEYTPNGGSRSAYGYNKQLFICTLSTE